MKGLSRLKENKYLLRFKIQFHVEFLSEYGIEEVNMGSNLVGICAFVPETKGG